MHALNVKLIGGFCAVINVIPKIYEFHNLLSWKHALNIQKLFYFSISCHNLHMRWMAMHGGLFPLLFSY